MAFDLYYDLRMSPGAYRQHGDEVLPAWIRNDDPAVLGGVPVLRPEAALDLPRWWTGVPEVLPRSLAGIGGVIRDIVARTGEIGPEFDVRPALTVMLNEFPLPLDLEPLLVSRRVGEIRLWYRPDQSGLSPAQAREFLAAELGLHRSHLNDGSDERLISFPDAILWRSDAGKLLVYAFLRLLRWHRDPDVIGACR
jgi:hypothetical protein